jgi:RHS repeat-associated protein
MASGACTTKRYYTLGSIVVAVRDTATTQLTYLLGDQLGSTTVSVNASTGAASTQRFLPYGAPRSGSIGATDRGWIGQTKDASTGLQYLNARYYDPAVGRFTATDPLADLGRPSTLDAYGYSGGSPVTLSDPTGLLNDLGGGGSCHPSHPVCGTPAGQQAAAEAVSGFVNYERNNSKDPSDPVRNAFIDNGWLPPAPKQGWLDKWVPALFFDMNRCESFGKQCAIQYAKLGSFLYSAASAAVALEAAAARAGVAAGAPTAANAAAEPAAFVAGELFETSVTTSVGRVGVLADVATDGAELTLRNVAIYGESGNLVNQVGARTFVQLRNSIATQAAAEGFSTLRIMGTRVAGSSSAAPGKVVDIVVDLTKFG